MARTEERVGCLSEPIAYCLVLARLVAGNEMVP